MPRFGSINGSGGSSESRCRHSRELTAKLFDLTKATPIAATAKSHFEVGRANGSSRKWDTAVLNMTDCVSLMWVVPGTMNS
jgi:hypothetical protein